MPLRTRYQQGGEKQLIDAILHKQVANGALPVSTGAIVQNVGTAFAVYVAVQKNKPLVERIVTVTGDGIKQPLGIGASRLETAFPIMGPPRMTFALSEGRPPAISISSRIGIPNLIR